MHEITKKVKFTQFKHFRIKQAIKIKLKFEITDQVKISVLPFAMFDSLFPRLAKKRFVLQFHCKFSFFFNYINASEHDSYHLIWIYGEFEVELSMTK